MYLAAQLPYLAGSFKSDLSPLFKSVSEIPTFEYWAVNYVESLKQGNVRFIDTDAQLGYATKPTPVGSDTSNSRKNWRVIEQVHDSKKK